MINGYIFLYHREAPVIHCTPHQAYYPLKKMGLAQIQVTKTLNPDWRFRVPYPRGFCPTKSGLVQPANHGCWSNLSHP